MAGSGNDRVPAPSFNPWTAAYEYAVDAWQRGVLYADVMRQRGNQYHEHMAKRAPNVLSMEFELVLDGRCLPRPVNYGLLRITPPAGVETDPIKRPFLVVDPRAGHGPGIGGFKPESEIGVALRAGHPCYFATFLPQPMPTQTVEDVMMAEARFLEEIIALQPNAEGKPVVVANCQAGWQIMMTAAVRPELFGPIIVAGAPLSYWAGWRGMNPMRYAGGLLGGSWLTATDQRLRQRQVRRRLAGAELREPQPRQHAVVQAVQPVLQGGHRIGALPELREMVGRPRLPERARDPVHRRQPVRGQPPGNGWAGDSDGIRIDLRNIRSPIVVFSSFGDNITPPPQALGWIPDLYQNEAEVLAHGQTIVYAVHESIGHLGIFVSGSVAPQGAPGVHVQHRHDRRAAPGHLPGRDRRQDAGHAQRRPGLRQLRAVVRAAQPGRRARHRGPQGRGRPPLPPPSPGPPDINLGMYRSFLQPWVRAMVTPQSAEWAQRLHPLRLPYELISDRNPLIAPIAQVAQQVREQRKPVSVLQPLPDGAGNVLEPGRNQSEHLAGAARLRRRAHLHGRLRFAAGAGPGRPGRALRPAAQASGRVTRAPPLHGRARRRAAIADAGRRPARGRDPHAAVCVGRRGRPGRTQLRADPQDARRIRHRARPAGVRATPSATRP